MSGDIITNLKVGKDQPRPSDLDYVKRLLEPFDDVGDDRFLVERFTELNRPSSTLVCRSNNIFVFVAILLVLFINLPMVKSELNEYVIFLITAFLLFGVVY
jgi:hypothetical protein